MSKNNNVTRSHESNKKIAYSLATTFGILFFIDFLIISMIYTWSDWVATLIFSLLFIMPGYISNAGMVITGGGKPIDGGKNFIDGRRLFGSHKTWKGFLGPLIIGIPISMAVYLLFLILWPVIVPIVEMAASMGQYKLYSNVSIYEFYFIGGPIPYGLLILLIRCFLCGYGASIGDLVGSFLKRRFNISSGAPFWLVDQLDFVIFSIILGAIPALFIPGYLAPDINIIIFLIILTPSVDIIANVVAYVVELKEVPW
jgi:CDP-2,3-bis-(O-geranylgeranyl)-sn-glycerol synthase